MKIIRILSFLTAGIVALAITGCEKSNVSPKAADPESVKFSVFVDPSDSDVKSVVVTHNGDASLTWYGFLSEDLTSDLGELVSKKAATLSDKDLYAGNGHEFKCKTLAGVDYRFIVFGVNLDGKVYGEPVAAHVISSLSFALTPGELTGETVTVNVKHNGSDSNTWYGFITDDLETPAEKLVESNIPSNASEFMTGKDKDLLFEGLEPLSTYRVIVTGVTELGTFGEPAEITVKTAKYAQSKNYSFKYDGFIESEEYGPVNTATITVSENAKSRYYIYIDRSTIQNNFDTWDDYLDHVIASTAEDVQGTVEEYGVTVDDVLMEGSQKVLLGLYEGEYVGFVVSLDDDLAFTGDISWTTFKVVEPEVEFKVNPYWELSVEYAAAPGNPNQFKVYIDNACAESSASLGYYFDYLPKSEIEKAGGIEAYVRGYLENYRYLFNLYTYYGIDPLYYGTDFKSFSADAGVEYVGFVVGFTPLYYLTGQYAAIEFTPEATTSGAPAFVMSDKDNRIEEVQARAASASAVSAKGNLFRYRK